MKVKQIDKSAEEAEREVVESELDEYLAWRLQSAKNLIDLTLLALREGYKYLLPTGIETLYDKVQGMIDDYCVEDNDNVL
jgi:hypothetical protein